MISKSEKERKVCWGDFKGQTISASLSISIDEAPSDGGDPQLSIDTGTNLGIYALTFTVTYASEKKTPQSFTQNYEIVTVMSNQYLM